MIELTLHDFQQKLGAAFTTVNGAEVVADYGESAAGYNSLRQTAAVLDFSFRSRLCLTGADRVRFLHGQVTNDINALRPGQGCYAALVTAKGKMQSDLNIFYLPDELLLDFSDNGIGITEDKAAHIFDAFFTTKPSGTGIGLALCRTIVEDHGGSLWVSQGEEHGARFHLKLPTRHN